jgi:hypothetical protein
MSPKVVPKHEVVAPQRAVLLNEMNVVGPWLPTPKTARRPCAETSSRGHCLVRWWPGQQRRNGHAEWHVCHQGQRGGAIVGCEQECWWRALLRHRGSADAQQLGGHHGNSAVDGGGGIYRLDSGSGTFTGIIAANVFNNTPNNCASGVLTPPGADAGERRVARTPRRATQPERAG